jgi:hypothetical protein
MARRGRAAARTAAGTGSRQDGCPYRQACGGGCVQGWVDGDLPVQAAQAENPRDAPGGDHQPQLCAAADGPLPRPHHGIGAGMIAGHGRGHVRDQRDRAEVDDRQQRIADLPGVGCSDVPGKRDDGVAADPPDRVEILKLGQPPRRERTPGNPTSVPEHRIADLCIAESP